MGQRGVIKTARRRYDALTCHPRFRTLDSDLNQFKVHEFGSGTLSFEARAGGSTQQRLSVDIEHNLGYQPMFLAWAKEPSDVWKQNPIVNTGSTGPTKWCTGFSRITDNIIRFYIYIYDNIDIGAYDAFDVDYEYIIFIDPSKDAWS